MALRFQGLLVVLLACCHRSPVVPPDGGASPAASQDLLLLPAPSPDAPREPLVCREGLASWMQHDDPRGNFTLVTSRDSVVTTVDVRGANALESAAGIDLSRVAGLVATRPAQTSSPSGEAESILQDLLETLGGQGSVAVRAAGSTGVSAEGLPSVVQIIWDVSTRDAVNAGHVRNLVMSAALNRPLRQLEGLPNAVNAVAREHVVMMTVALRPNQLVVSAAVARRADHDSPLGGLWLLVDDLGNGTAVVSADRRPLSECDIETTSQRPMADIIWIVDESGSMNDNRQDIVENANVFFGKALAAGLDFRMGVAGMKKPGDGVQLGKFCSGPGFFAADDGGEDRFLLSHEQGLFAACVKNPPYYEGGAEHGLTHGYHALKRHLPRAENAPNRIRTGAQLAVIFVTDEAAQELKQGSDGLFGRRGFLTQADYRKSNCALSREKKAKMALFLRPLEDLYKSAGATVHVVGGTCQNSCNADIAYGYRELVQSSGGQEGEVCQHDLNATLQVIIDTIIGSASPRPLQHVPISSTLAVEANGQRLDRSRSRGYVYNAASNALTFINVDVPKGTVVVASYQRFR